MTSTKYKQQTHRTWYEHKELCKHTTQLKVISNKQTDSTWLYEQQEHCKQAGSIFNSNTTPNATITVYLKVIANTKTTHRTWRTGQAQ